MIIVLDANVIIAALLGSRGKLTILTSQNHKFYAPSFVIEEIRKYKQEICNRMNWTDDEFNTYFDALMFFINLLEYNEYAQYMEKASNAIKKRDITDADYLACAILLNADFIWSEDKDFSEQKLVKVKSTAQFIEDNK